MESTIRKSSMSIDEAAMAIMKLWAEARSKDPSTRVGACIIDAVTGGLFMGYNGFPAGVPDWDSVWSRKTDAEEPEWKMTKYDLVIHAEVNAVRKALVGGINLSQATLITTVLPCPECMKTVVLGNGIRRLVFSDPTYKSQTPRDYWLSKRLAALGLVDLVQIGADR